MQRLKLNTGFFRNKRYVNDIFQVHWRAALLYQKHHHVNLNVVSNWHDRMVQGAKNILEFCHRNRSWGSKTPKSKITSGTHRSAVTWNKAPGLSEQPPSSAAGRNWDPKVLQWVLAWYFWDIGEGSMDFCILLFSLSYPTAQPHKSEYPMDLARLGNEKEGKGFRERESMSKHLPGLHLHLHLSLSAITASFPELEQPKFLNPIKCKELFRDKLTPWLPWNWMTGFDVTASYKNKWKNKNYLREILSSNTRCQATLELDFSPGFFIFLIFFFSKGKGQGNVYFK